MNSIKIGSGELSVEVGIGMIRVSFDIRVQYNRRFYVLTRVIEEDGKIIENPNSHYDKATLNEFIKELK